MTAAAETAVRVDARGLTDIGKKRKANEDQFVIMTLSKAAEVRETSLTDPRVFEALRGPQGWLFVVADGTRKETCDQLGELRALGREAAGEVPELLALNKSDLVDQWALGPEDEQALASAWEMVRTSAKTGAGVEEAFQRLGRATLAAKEARS